MHVPLEHSSLVFLLLHALLLPQDVTSALTLNTTSGALLQHPQWAALQHSRGQQPQQPAQPLDRHLLGPSMSQHSSSRLRVGVGAGEGLSAATLRLRFITALPQGLASSCSSNSRSARSKEGDTLRLQCVADGGVAGVCLRLLLRPLGMQVVM